MKLLGIICSLAIVLSLAPSAKADTVYTYTGNPYTNCFGIYALDGGTTTGFGDNPCAGPYALSITFDVMAGVNMDNREFDILSSSPDDIGGIITQYVTSFTFTDGLITITQADATDFGFNFATDSNGNVDSEFTYVYADIVHGDISASMDDSSLSGIIDASGIDGSGGNIGDGREGTWTMTTTDTPEPSILLLLGTGLLALVGLGWRRSSQTSGSVIS